MTLKGLRTRVGQNISLDASSTVRTTCFEKKKFFLNVCLAIPQWHREICSPATTNCCHCKIASSFNLNLQKSVCCCGVHSLLRSCKSAF